MKKIIFLLTCMFIGTVLASCASAQKHAISRKVEGIINAVDPDVNIGIKIANLDSNDIVFEKNQNRHFVPGSSIKVFTLAAALHYLGPAFRFTTQIFTDGFLHDGKAIKNLYIKGSGDPSLMDYDLASLASELRQMHITEITGNIYVDDQVFDDVIWARGAMWDDRNKGYSAPTSGLNLNYNRLQIKTVPANVSGKTAFAIVEPRSSYIKVLQQAKTLKDGGRNISVAVQRGKHRESLWPTTEHEGLKAGDEVILTGQIARTANPQYSLLAINDPALWAGTVFKEHLTQLGIKIHGHVARMATPEKSTFLARHESRQLSEALIDFTKISNNVANDALVKAIAANSGVKPASFQEGLKLINSFLKTEVKIDPSSLITADGAGLSRYNLVSPEQMIKLLNYAAKHFHMGPEFMAALPIGGEDGLLASRLTEQNLRGNIRAKTGTMTGLSSLVGYLTNDDGNRYVFAIMINNFIGSTTKYTKLQDQILAALFKNDQTQLATAK